MENILHRIGNFANAESSLDLLEINISQFKPSEQEMNESFEKNFKAKPIQPNELEIGRVRDSDSIKIAMIFNLYSRGLPVPGLSGGSDGIDKTFWNQMAKFSWKIFMFCLDQQAEDAGYSVSDFWITVRNNWTLVAIPIRPDSKRSIISEA